MTTDLPWMRLRPTLIAAGLTDGELRRSRAAGRLATLRRGAYVYADDGRLGDAQVRHTLLIQAAVACLERDAVVSHASAAVLHGLPVWSIPLDRVHLTRAQRTGGRVTPTVHLHTAPLAPGEITEVDGMAVTTPARTVADLARSVPFEPAVTVADAALRAGLDDRRLEAAVDRAARWRGAPAGRRAVAFADGRSESVGESRSRVALHRACLPPPTPQWEVWRGGELVGRCDFGWPAHGVVAEFDGRAKYGRLLRAGQEPGEVVFEEKLREDALRAHGLQVVRWTWRQLRDFDSTARRLREALAG